MSEVQYQKDKKTYGFLASLPIIIAITHLLFQVFYISTINYHSDTGEFTNLYTLGELFTLSSFVSVLTGLSSSLSMSKTLPSILGVCITLLLIFLSSSAVKGKKKPFKLSFYIYIGDSILILPAILCSLLLDTKIKYQVYDIIIMIFIHIIFVLFFIYGLKVIKRIEDYEVELTKRNNTIHIN